MAEEFIGLDSNPAQQQFGGGENINNMAHIDAEPHDDMLAGRNNDDANVRPSTPPNTITVNVTDRQAPIVLLFGAPSSGKTMTLVRLAQYLRDVKGYTVTVDGLFCLNAWEYAKNAEKFNGMLGTRYALKGTDHNDFLFIKVQDRSGHTICQILEGAGEDYFSPNSHNAVNAPLPTYMNTVFASQNKKCWIFLAEYQWMVTPDVKINYVNRIQFCKANYSNRNDKFIILGIKADMSGCMMDARTIHEANAKRALFQQYVGLDVNFRRKTVLPWANENLYKFVPFITGFYNNNVLAGERIPYTPANDVYPAKLWKTITTSLGIKG